MYTILIAALTTLYACTTCIAQEFTIATITPDYKNITLAFQLSSQEVLFQDSIVFSTNNPDMTIASWSVDRTPEPYLDRASGGSRPAYKGSGTITLHCNIAKLPSQEFKLFLHYFGLNNRTPQERQFTIPAAESTTPSSAQPYNTAAPVTHNKVSTPFTPQSTSYVTLPSISELLYEGLHSLVQQSKAWYQIAKTYASDTLTHTSSLALQLLFAFALGILMSLTPCIYPMIPITVGLLGTSASNSFMRNFVLAAAYTNGLALVCAALGLTAALFGAHCGQLACNPWVVIPLILLLAYFGGSMLGWYELYIPRFMQPATKSVQRGSLLSAFMLGVASGTVASPCMSPGLALLLSIVATLNNYFLGFLLLFVFGVGSSIPLLLIGTFSSSLHMLPRAGLWMNEIKRFFGFMLIMVCFYYAEALINPAIALAGAAIFTFMYSIIYAFHLLKAHTATRRIYTFCVTTLLLTAALFEGYTAAMWYILQQSPSSAASHWMYDYHEARARARADNKLLLLDFTASWCSYCVMLDIQLLRHPDVQPLLQEVVAVKIDGSSLSESYTALTAQYKVPGIPLLLLVDPTTERIIATWNSSLLEKAPHQWVEEVRLFYFDYTPR